MKPALRLLAVLLPLTALADVERQLRDAATTLARTSYSWETTTRQRFKGETTEPRLDPNAPVELEGKFDPKGFTQFTIRPSRELAVPVTTVWQHGDAVAHTPLGWLRRSEIRQTPSANREVEFEGKQVRLSRVFGVALKATTLRPLTEELLDFVADLKSCRSAEGLILGELRDRTIEQLWGDASAKRAPETHGTIIFKIGEQGLTEYHVVIAIGFPNSRTKKIAWTVQQWSTRVTGIGTTTVAPPDEAVRALARDR
jgi:hypothetical protein